MMPKDDMVVESTAFLAMVYSSTRLGRKIKKDQSRGLLIHSQGWLHTESKTKQWRQETLYSCVGRTAGPQYRENIWMLTR